MVSKIRQFVAHILPGIIRPMRVLWNEIIGFVFLALAVWGIPATVRSIREFDGDAESIFRVIMTCIFALLMAGFGVSSFMRARKISRS